jgi:3-oxoacyl-[acyl-carrier protein] reductase
VTDLSDKVVLVTGSSRGLGKGIAIGLARHGALVVVHYLQNREAAEQAGEEISKVGREPLILQADVRQWQQVQSLIDKVIRFYGRIDVLVNNVGAFLQSSLADLDIESWHNLLDSNLNSVFYCCKAVLPYMREQKWGRIINIAVANADRIHAYQRITAYAVAKTAVLILTRSFAVEEAKNGITVNAISPGFMDNGGLSEQEKTRQSLLVPQKRLGNVDDLLPVICALIDDRSRYVTGSNTVVSGGWGL